ncbi:MAG TPA: molybdenum cofactor biosynthesis protein MoaE [Arachnia sp.]|nr:molybdenum cofactor biosynthesis protein MoaE [Arachnia sp.]HMT86777.1 molybdenum cofactor biosynthesis protein MoaE [Arachnia sp.]
MMEGPRLVAGITDVDVDCDALRASVSDDRAGAIVTFEGIVRNHDHGVAVTGIEYVGHPSAAEVLAGIVAGFADREVVHAVAVQHRVGYLGIGGMALFVAVSASHRKQAFDCASELIERVKAELPIWKKQFLADGSHEWSQCP